MLTSEERAQVDDTTAEVDEESAHFARRSRVGRRIFTTLLVVFLALGLLGVFGVRSGSKDAAAGRYQVHLDYARSSRPGLTTPFSFEVTRTGGFPDGRPIRIAVSTKYLETLQLDGIQPEPSSSTGGDKTLVWEFDPPSGDTLSVSVDGHVDPSASPGRRHGTLSVLGDDDRPVASVHFMTWVVP